MKFVPHVYQDHGIDHIIDNPFSALWLDMGLGKTVIVLTAFLRARAEGFKGKMLIIAPLKVAESTWTAEALKWDHTKGLTFSLVLGTQKQRKEALKAKADIYVINRDNVAWLVTYYKNAWPFYWTTIDESSSFKDNKSNRFRALRQVRPLMRRMTQLTGTPAPNGLEGIWSQLYLLDQGQRLGKYITHYRARYFTRLNEWGERTFSYKLKRPSVYEDIIGEDFNERCIYDKIKDIVISMKAEDWLDMPELREIDVRIELNDKDREAYRRFERQQVLKLTEEDKLTVPHAAALTNKLAQYANGAVYDEDRVVHEIHTEKLRAVVEDVESLDGNPILIFYTFKHDLTRLQEALKKFNPRVYKNNQDLIDWNKGEVQVMLAHPAATAFGLNLQEGGHNLGWYGLNWSLELYQQAIARILRQGQKHTVFMRRWLVADTMDEEIAKRLLYKDGVQGSLMDAVKARIRIHKKL